MRQVLVGESIAVAELEPALLAPDQIRIEVAFAGICGSELHPLVDPEAYAGEGAELDYEQLPSGRDDPDGDAGFGHEYSGTVVELGADARRFELGERVVCMPRWPCMRCRQCVDGQLIYCERFTMPARGAWAEQIVVPERVAFRIPDEVSLRQATLCEPLACALRGVDRAQAPPGHVALVIGGGPMGLLTAALARGSGARTVLLSEPQAARRRIAEQLGAIPVDPLAEDLGEAVAAASDGLGVHVAYEVVGRPETLAEAIELAAPGGTVVVVGVAPPQALAPIRPWRLFERELSVVGAFGPEAAFQRALAWLPKLALEPVITHVLELDEIERAIEIAAAGDCGKVLLAP